MIEWSYYFYDEYVRLIDSEDVATDTRWGGHDDVQSTKEYMPWLKRNNFICILQYKKLVLESFKEITCYVLERGMMEVVDAS